MPAWPTCRGCSNPAIRCWREQSPAARFTMGASTRARSWRSSPQTANQATANAMRARTVFIILLVLILLVAFGPALVAVGSPGIAELVFGCQVDLNRVIPCVIGGKDYGQTFYDLGFAIWHSYLSLPARLVLFVLLTAAATT